MRHRDALLSDLELNVATRLASGVPNRPNRARRRVLSKGSHYFVAGLWVATRGRAVLKLKFYQRFRSEYKKRKKWVYTS